MAEVPGTLEGWYVLHDYRRIDWPRWKMLEAGEQASILEEAGSFLTTAEQVGDSPEGNSAVYSILGHKADLLMLHLRPTLDALGAIERAFANTRIADYTSPATSYVSVTELSLYEASARGGTEDPETLRQAPFVQNRLKPTLPAIDAMPYICFYPMNKRRGEQVNWYAEEMEARRKMMREHGATGARYRGRIQQMITGSTGLDDWEWGVTLFARDPLDIKKLVYEMRFDEVSAKYGEFGVFLLGQRLDVNRLAEWMKG